MPVDLKKDNMGSVIDDFYKSDAPQFKGKSKKKRRQMAIAAKLSAESVLYFQEAQRSWHKGYDSGDKTVPRRKALNRAQEFDNRGENERASKIRSISAKLDQGRDSDARKDARNIKVSKKVGKLPTASISDKRGAVSGDVQKKLGEGKIERVMDTVRKYTNRKKKPKKQHQYPAGASHRDAGDVARQTLDQRQRENSVGPFKPIDYRGI